MDSSQIEKSIVPKKIKERTFKLPIEESIKIIEQVKKIQKQSKSIKPDENRKSYQQLLQWVLTKLQASKQYVYTKKIHFKEQNIQIQNIQNETLDQEVQIEQTQTIQTLMQEMIDMFKKQCKEKSQLMQVCFSYFTQLINSYTKHYEKQLHQTFKTYNIALTQMQDQYEDKLVNFQTKLSFLQGEKQTKWKNIYMLAKDNRILRRQKGKLLRTIQQQDQKIKILEEQLCQIAKQNQMNKLVIRFQNDTNNLKIFLKNRIAIMKFERVLENYPKKAMKVLSNDLLKLQIEQLNSLDSKIDYIKRVIIESGDIFDQYQDLNELVTKPNVMVFNMFSQTDLEDISPPIQKKDASVNSDSIVKKLKLSRKICNMFIQYSTQEKQRDDSIKNLNILLANQYKTHGIDKKKLLYRLEICSQVFTETLALKNKKISHNFDIFHSTQVSQKPKFKDKTKLFMMQPTKQDYLSSVNGTENLMSQTFQNTIKKEAPIVKRKSEALGRKNYAIKNPLLNTINLGRLSEQKKDASSYFSFQNNPNPSNNDDTINKTNQSSEIQKSQIDQSENKNIQDDILRQQILSKFKKNKRLSRRITQIIPSTFQINQQSNDSPTLCQNQQIVKNKGKIIEKQNDKSEKMTLKSKSNESTSNNRKKQNKNMIKKMSRVKTSQNLKKNYYKKRQSTQMGFIEEQQSQNQGYIQSKKQKSRVKDRFSQNQTLNLPKGFGFYAQSNNLSQFKENYGNQFIEGKKKYRISINPADFEGKTKLSKFTSRNSSLNPNIAQRQSLNNADTCSMNSYFSNQNQQKIDYKALMTEAKAKQTFLEGLESEFLDPILIKPYQIKKIVQKILKSMYIRRKQLLSGSNSPCLKNYIEHFLKQLYGEKWKGQKNVLRYIFTVYDRESSSNIQVFNLLMNSKVHVEYLQDLFRLYLTMIQKNEFSSSENYLVCNKSKAVSILKYLLSIYFDQKTAIQVQLNLPILNNFEVDLNELFIVVETQIRKYTIQTQIYHFLCNLIPQNQPSIEFSQMKEILFLFKNQPNYHTHLARLKYFFKLHGRIVSNQHQTLINKNQNTKNIRNSKSQKSSAFKKTYQKQEIKPQIQILPLHKICLYFKRYQWTNLLEINTFVEQKYTEIVGIFIQQEAIKFISKYCLKMNEKQGEKAVNLQSGMMNISGQANQMNQKTKTHPLEWIFERSKQLIRNHYRYKVPLYKYFLMFTHLSILMYELQMGMQEVLSEPLNLLTLEFKRIKTKEQVDTFLKI